MDQLEIEALLSRPKLALRWSGWDKRSNHAGHLIGVAEMFEVDGTTIPGVTIEFEIKAAVSAVSCLYLFTLMSFAARERRRIYQLEVAPSAKRTHNGLSVIYGPHEHVGVSEPTQVIHPSVNCESWDQCARWFFTRVSVTPFPIPNPFNT